MGNKNDYLTLEESALTLGRPVSFVKATISEGKLGAKLAGGRWMIGVRDLEKLRASLPPEPEEPIHNFLTDSPSKNPPRVPGTEPTIKREEPQATRPGPSKSTPRGLELEVRVKDLEKQILELNDQIREETEKRRRAIRSEKPPSKVVLENLLLQHRQLGKQRHEAQMALDKEAQAKKGHTKKAKAKKQKVKTKKPRRRNAFDIDDIIRGHRLFELIKALDRHIKLEAAKYKETAKKGGVYDIEVLKKLVLKRAALGREYAKIPDPLALLLPLVRTWPKKAGQQKSKAPKRPSGQGSSPAKVPKVLPSSVVPTRHLPWRVLPPGELSVNAVSQYYDRLQRQNPRIKYERERITKAFSLNPEQCYVGKDELEGYIVYTFAHTPRALLECPVFGNAIYIIDSDWKRWSRMTKRELLAHSHDVTRIIHRGDWFREVKRELGIR